MTNTLSISAARANFPTLIDKVSENLDRYLITVNGQPKAVILSAEELESIEETADIMAIPGAKAALNRGLRQAKKRQGLPLEKVLR